MQLNRGNSLDPSARCARSRLLVEVLGLVDAGPAPVTNPWLPISIVTADGRCIANIDVGVLTLTLDGNSSPIGAIRSVAVAPEWRGRGLFRDLMREALAWCEAAGAPAILLYTEEPDLYTRFGFRPATQHAFTGLPPRPSGSENTRVVDVGIAADQVLVRRLVDARAPVSTLCALAVDAPLILANLAKDNSSGAAYAPEHDALIVFEEEADGTLVIEDVIASALPSAAQILGALGKTPARLKILFPPDRLGWHGAPIHEDSGLMIRGQLPTGRDHPLSLPTTAEF